MSEVFHSGELAVQERAGRSSGAVIRKSIPEIAADFLVTRPAVVIAGHDRDARMWATMLTGTPGFMQAPDPRIMVVHAMPLPSDPLAPLVARGGETGTILWDSHGRMRVNGLLEPRSDGFAIDTAQVYSNCGRYISRRQPLPEPDREPGRTFETESTVETGTTLSAAQMEMIGAADTFFIGTSHPDGPADASHRGGNPGFVVVDSPQTLRWPDYNGNAMFMTLGNITLNPRVGLLFPDWATGGLLQVSGRARVNWDPAAAATLPGAERIVELTVDAVQQTRRALRTSWSPATLSRYNPRSRSSG
ncbi:pyridoxamine 5'-phosphate oxidase family protein [Rathayibacter soli]|uniref:pyridoxamine 5'-phosphate oxidase family protein n=1 Tax=Rathayibacter soli TaxID=3144168 RepID=UPI0027E5AF66|nr:pyridoxamine 5'-phosphate oxidase family protein [Glaciibacter superstes]